MSFELVIIDGPQIGRRFPVGNVPMTFGRSPAAQLSFPQDNFISGNHLTVQSDGRSVLLTDLRSTNGTFLNGQRIGQAIANVGDMIKIGSMTLQVVFTQDPAPVPQQYFPPVPVVAQATTVIPTFAQQPPPPLPRMDLPLPPNVEIPAPPPPAAPPPPYVPYPPFEPQAAPPPYPGSAPPFPEPPVTPPPPAAAASPAGYAPYPPFEPQAPAPPLAGSVPPFPEPPIQPPSFPPSFPGSSGPATQPPPDALGSFQVGSSAFADFEPSSGAPPFPEPPSIEIPASPSPPPPEPLSQIALRAIREIPGPIFGLLNPLADPAVGELLRDANADLAGYCLVDSADPFAPAPAWAPYLLPLALDGDVLRQIIEQGWGAGWAALLTSQASYADLRTHFKKFVMVQVQSGAEPYFRFWEPPVLRNFFGAANPAELTMFCGPVLEWVMEADPSTSLLRAHNTPTGLSKTVVPLL